MKATDCLVVAPYSQIKFTDVSLVLAASIIRTVGDIALMMKAVNTSETSVCLYQTTQRNNSEDSHLKTRRKVGPQVGICF
jgi:hypothetical protein